ncbi:MAG: class I SAM-dependent methyltransferase [Thermodesulfobacteriota bacterium]|jgi:ubiquinone/menaquinone biosynthesis C-methylase UbiE
MTAVTILSQIAKIRDFEKGHRATHVINTGFRFGMLDALAESLEGLTVPDLALKLMLYAPFLKIWCQTAYHFEILDCDKFDRFKLQPFLDQVLGLDMSFRDHLARTDRKLGQIQTEGVDESFFEYIRTGRVHMGKSPLASFAACRGTKSIATIFLFMIFPGKQHLKNKLEGGCTFLDVGCGSGNLILEFAQIFKKSRFVGVDPDLYGIENAERSISELGLGNRVTVENLGGEEIHFHEEFDLAGMVLTLHEILPEVRLEALNKTCQALKKGGLLLILDYPYPSRMEDFRNPRFDYGIIEQYFEALGGIVHIPKEEQDELLSKAGFKTIERMPVGEGGMLDFISAEK